MNTDIYKLKTVTNSDTVKNKNTQNKKASSLF